MKLDFKRLLGNEMAKVFYAFSLKPVFYFGPCNLESTLKCVGPKVDSSVHLLLKTSMTLLKPCKNLEYCRTFPAYSRVTVTVEDSLFTVLQAVE